MLVSVIGLTALVAARIESKSQQAACGATRARVNARSAIEIATAFTYSDAAWRSHYSSFSSLMPMTLDRGACSATITQPDGTVLVVDSDDPVQLSSIGTMGLFAQPQAIYKWTVAAHHPALNLLAMAAHANGSMTVNDTVTADEAPLSTNQTLTNWGTINGDIEARTLANYGVITGLKTLNGPAKTMPSATVLEYYRSRATTLSAFSVGAVMEWRLLSPASNPYGTANADGLYYIRPSGDLTIRNDRIVGTLVVELGSGHVLTLEQGLSWEPARSDYPTLIVVGNCQMWTATTLNESGIINFNPSTTPFEGVYDEDRIDTYSSSIKGVIHVIGATSVTAIYGSTHTVGAVIAEGSLNLYNGAVLTADLNLMSSPPQKYRLNWLVLDQGTWSRVLP